MEKKKITMILGVACAVVLIVAIALIASPKDDIEVVPNDPNQVVDTNNPGNSENQENIGGPVINDDIRKDGEKTLPIIFNGQVAGEAKVLIENAMFNVSIKDVNSSGALNFEEKNGNWVLDTDDYTYTLTEEDIVIFNKHWEEQKKAVTDTDADSVTKVEGSAEAHVGMPGYIKRNDKAYLTEHIIVLIGNGSYVNDKGITIITSLPAEDNSSKVEAALALEGLVDMEADDFTKLGEAFFNANLNFTIESFGPVNSTIDSDAIKEVLFNSFNNSSNIIYSKKIDNKYIVMCGENVASALMNTILGSVSHSDLYANVRLVVETDSTGKITSVYGDSYYIFDGRDIYYYITGNAI